MGRLPTIPLFLAIAIALVATYSLAYPSYLAFQERSTVQPPWNAYTNAPSQREDVDELADLIRGSKDRLVVVDVCKAQGFITANPLAMTDASAIFPLLADALLINQPDRSIYPMEAFVPQQFLIEGNPRAYDGLVMDAFLARQLGVGAGDAVYVGLLYPEGSPGAQEVPIPGEMAPGGEGPAENIVFQEQRVAAVVMPSGWLFDSFAWFQPEENVRAYEAEGISSCTQLYVYGNVDEAQINSWGVVASEETGEDVWFTHVSEEVQHEKDLYAQDKGGIQVFYQAILAGVVVAILLMLFDGLRRQQHMMRTLMVAASLGAPRGALARSFGVASLVLNGVVVAIGCAAGLVVAQLAYVSWIPPELGTAVAVGAIAFALVMSLLQCGVLALRLKKADVYDFLAEEKE